MAQGALDLALTRHYDAALLVANGLATETGTIQLDRAQVEVRGGDGELLVTKEVATSGVVEPGTAGSQGWGIAPVRMLDSSDVDAVGLASWVPEGVSLILGIAVRVEGTAQSGHRHVSPTFSFPIRVCTRCLVAYPPEADDPTQPGYQCSWASSPVVDEAPCRLGQDQVADCRFCAATVPSCVAPP